MPSREFLWFQEMGASLAQQYAFRWIAVDGEQLSANWNEFSRIIVGTGDSLGEAVEIARQRDLDPLNLFYVFVRPPFPNHTRQGGG
jgi:hypothetical protein